MLRSKSVFFNSINQLNQKIIGLNNRVNRVIFLLSICAPLVCYSQSGSTPTDLNSTAPLTIAENQPIGSIVGEFNATDPDINATLTYSLVTGAGDTHNYLFNGYKWHSQIAAIFDYESNSSTFHSRGSE